RKQTGGTAQLLTTNYQLPTDSDPVETEVLQVRAREDRSRVDAIVAIDRASHVAQKPPVDIVNRPARVDDPPVLAVVAAEAVLHLEFHPHLEGVEKRLQAAVTVVGMHAVEPAVAQFVGH